MRAFATTMARVAGGGEVKRMSARSLPERGPSNRVAQESNQLRGCAVCRVEAQSAVVQAFGAEERAIRQQYRVLACAANQRIHAHGGRHFAPQENAAHRP